MAIYSKESGLLFKQFAVIKLIQKLDLHPGEERRGNAHRVHLQRGEALEDVEGLAWTTRPVVERLAHGTVAHVLVVGEALEAIALGHSANDLCGDQWWPTA